VGDSRTYLLRRKHLFQLTEDHNLANHFTSRGTLTPEQAARHPQGQVLTRALGPTPDVDPDTTHVGPLQLYNSTLDAPNVIAQLTSLRSLKGSLKVVQQVAG
jgi:hypothetical protein